MIVTPDRRLRVFISSTLDLVDERTAARHAAESLDLAAVMFEAGARAHPPRALYRAYVEQSDVFVGIYASRYGWIAPGMDISGLEDEYNLSERMPRLVYIRTERERDARLVALLERVADDGLSYRRFSSAEELETLLRTDLVVLLTERFHANTTDLRAGPPAAPLPEPAGLFVGRKRELAEVGALLLRDDVRVVTILGPGGIGKTRLALATGHDVAHRFDVVHFVSLSSVREPELVPDTIASAVGVAATDGYPPLAAIADAFRNRLALLVLDNFEHVIAAASTVASLLASCRGLTILVTSRSPLRVHGEHQVWLEPLALPGEDINSAAAAGYEAIELFVETARLARPDLQLDDEMLVIIAAICREVDGLPLGIELAAAMLRFLTPAALLERLRLAPTEIGGAMRDMPERHHRLSNAIRWSYELLDHDSQRMFEEVSCFRGGFTLEHAEAICSGRGDALEHLATLTDQSLLRADVHAQDGPRFHMLSTIQRFAAERLQDRSDRDGVLSRHSVIFLSLAERVGEANGHEPAVLDEVEHDLNNIRAALEWSVGHGGAERVAAAMGASWWFWWMRGLLPEGRLWTERALADPDVDDAARSRALLARGMFALWSGDYGAAMPALQDARDRAGRCGDRRTRAYAEIGAGLVRGVTTSVDDGMSLIRDATSLLEELGDEGGALVGVAAAGFVQAITRQFTTSRELMQEHLRRARNADRPMELGIVEWALAQLLLEHGEVDAAVDLLATSLDHLASARCIGSTILTLEVIAEVGVSAGLYESAGQVLAATNDIRVVGGTRVPAAAAQRLQHLEEAIRVHAPHTGSSALEHVGFNDGVAAGRRLLLELGRVHA